jgi:hypothetical protein
MQGPLLLTALPAIVVAAAFGGSVARATPPATCSGSITADVTYDSFVVPDNTVLGATREGES